MSRLLRLRPTLLRPLPLPLTTANTLSTTTRLAYSSSSFQTGPSPPRLPADQQAEFERLQRAAEAALSSHTTVPSSTATSSPDAPLSTSRHVSTPSQSQLQPQSTSTGAGTAGGSVEAGTFSGGMRKGAPPEFEGDKHPTTGEVGGPKNEPLRWGSGGDWSFNGRVTDF
ncbi:hypothetical protein C8A01DRAFT_50138 [Parachaetomium inaequale]|uniref:Succinate dehydrogenase assembly factor 4, mitochondrial n=1 Tax=Parachaetomium inaequale TaxID=2588326 RepID=A0AAN6P7L6_9PEZI|nr:hypothetical protein C8A01DRAFT_50138 [Parachaetomium inaequale]